MAWYQLLTRNNPQNGHQRGCFECEIDPASGDRLDSVWYGVFARINSVGGAELERELQAIITQIDSDNLAGTNQFGCHDGTKTDRTKHAIDLPTPTLSELITAPAPTNSSSGASLSTLITLRSWQTT